LVLWFTSSVGVRGNGEMSFDNVKAGADLGSIYDLPRIKRVVWPRNPLRVPLALFLYGGEIYGRTAI